MPRFQAKHIADLAPGSLVEIKGRRYLRAHSISRYDDLVVDMETGWLGPWTNLVLEHEMVVDVPRDAAGPTDDLALARAQVAECWQTPETSSIEMDTRLVEAFAARLAGWIGEAKRYASNADFWRNKAARRG